MELFQGQGSVIPLLISLTSEQMKGLELISSGAFAFEISENGVRGAVTACETGHHSTFNPENNPV